MQQNDPASRHDRGNERGEADPQGIHVALIVIDAIVDLPRTRAKMPDKPDTFYRKPEDMAATDVWLTRQARSAWTFEAVVRPFGENW